MPEMTYRDRPGWTLTSDTWVYASATSFTVAGVDRTAQFPVGAKLQYTNGGSIKYAYVASAAFSTNTTVTLLANSTYSIADSAITLPHYSYQDTPQGFPNWGSGDQNSALALEVAANATDIATNATAIASGVTNTATNATNIGTNTTDIAANFLRSKSRTFLVGANYVVNATSTSTYITLCDDLSITPETSEAILDMDMYIEAQSSANSSQTYARIQLYSVLIDPSGGEVSMGNNRIIGARGATYTGQYFRGVSYSGHLKNQSTLDASGNWKIRIYGRLAGDCTIQCNSVRLHYKQVY